MSKSARKRQTVQETHAKMSFDRQIVAIAKVSGVHTIYSDDEGVRRFAEENNIKVIRTWELPKPPEIQMPLPFDSEKGQIIIAREKRAEEPDETKEETQANEFDSPSSSPGPSSTPQD